MSAPVMMGISSPTGSHLPALTEALFRLSPGDLVIEHGAGLYSTPLLARHDVRVLCAEQHEGWLEWARWMYSELKATAEFVPSWKQLVPRLTEAALLFVDGNAAERGKLIAAALERGVRQIIAHDTQEKDWHHYQIQPHMFTWSGYRVTHSAEDTHRTTAWLKST
jgi:hypothetical protein